MSWDMYMSYAGEDGLLLLRWRKIYNFKIKIVSFVIDSGSKMTAYAKFEV